MSFIYNMTDTWNNSGTTFTAIKVDVTNTASAAGSKLFDLQIGSVTKFHVDKDGNIAIGATDCLLYRAAANALALRNSTNGQSLRIFSTYTNDSNYEMVDFSWQDEASTFWILQKSAGSGTSRSIAFGRGNYAHRIVCQSDGDIRYYTETSADKHEFFTGSTSCAQLTTSRLAVAIDTAIPASGSSSIGLAFSNTASFGIFFGSGAPTFSAAQGSLYLRSDGSSSSTRLYVNTNGSTGWINFTTPS